MGTHIESAATAQRRGWHLASGAVRLSDAAARTCLERGHHRAEELDVLINAGIYREGNTAEPALASIIQEDLGANPGHPPRLGRHGTFSFDVLDGACGALLAARLMHAFLGDGPARHGLIVAADSDPEPHTSRGFPFTPAAGAMLLVHRDGDGGFQRFAQRTFPEHAGLFTAHLRFDPALERNVVEIVERPELDATAMTLAADVAREVLASSGLAAGDLDLLVASPYPSGFARGLAQRLGIPDDRVAHPPEELSATHTAGLIAALEPAMASGQFSRAWHTLFVTVGAGITVEVALYRG
jgi:3-oxoacyl-[acyl-carrier-protein] synthase-3